MSPKDSDSSNVSSISPEAKQMQTFVKQMLVGRFFIGTFQEKRYVEAMKSYRDVIVISEQENELIRDVEIVKKHIQNYYSEYRNHWIGITTPDIVGAPAGFCLWVELPEEVFGSYWYKIYRVKFRASETVLGLKIIRPVNTVGGTTSLSFTKMVGSVNSTNTPAKYDFSFNKMQTNLNTSFATTGKKLKDLMTVDNTSEAIKFVFLVLLALGSGLIKTVEFLGNFTIRLIHEFSFFINSITPIIIALINLIAKIIGGFYLLILSMWRDRKGTPPVYKSPFTHQLALSENPDKKFNTTYYRRSYTPQRGGKVVITPVE